MLGILTLCSNFGFFGKLTKLHNIAWHLFKRNATYCCRRVAAVVGSHWLWGTKLFMICIWFTDASLCTDGDNFHHTSPLFHNLRDICTPVCYNITLIVENSSLLYASVEQYPSDVEADVSIKVKTLPISITYDHVSFSNLLVTVLFAVLLIW